jgi:hypothetical protein
MIFIARLLSLIGATVTIVGMGAIAIMILSEGLQDYWPSVLFGTLNGVVLLVIGQLCGNDLFKVLGKDSIFALKSGSGSNGGVPYAGWGDGGDGGSCD